jgi:hypothetical protein
MTMFEPLKPILAGLLVLLAIQLARRFFRA